jgi:L-alanine-DL-glutamate epimerase-like enolase superfamily enzyme
VLSVSVIEALDLQTLRIPLLKPVVFATGVLKEAEHVLLRVKDSDGAVGCAEIIPRPMIYGDTVRSTYAVVADEIRPRVIGRSLDARDQIMQELSGLIGNYVIKGALDMAILDLWSRKIGVSCHAAMGGFTDRVEVTGMIGVASPEEMADEAVDLHERYGIKSFKVKVGFDAAKDVEALTAIRMALPLVHITVDANHNFSGLEARRFVAAASDLDIAGMDEPTDGEHPVERQVFAGSSGMPIMGDESCPTPGAVGREGLAGRINLVSIKVARTGYRASDVIRGFCEATGIIPVMGSQGETGLGTLCALAFGAAHASTTRQPGEYAYFLELERDILVNTPTISEGRMTVPEGPGNGAVLDEEVVAFYSREP